MHSTLSAVLSAVLAAFVGAGLVVPARIAESEAAALVERLRASRDEVAAATAVHFASTHDGWLATGLEVAAGQSVTLLAIEPANAAAGAASAGDLLWVRSGEGEAFHAGGAHHTFRANDDGEIAVALRPARLRWADCRGSFPAELAELERTALGVDVVAVAWRGEPEPAMTALTELAPVAAALARYRSAPRLPHGFQPLCHLRNSPVFSAWTDGERRGVRGQARGSAGIIKRGLDLPLEDSSEITFSWRYDTLPAQGPETDPRHHDYSSIAIELDNGQDITWMWGTHVAAGTSFRCPLRWWDERETHIVLQSGNQGLGEWFTHTRKIAEDYDKAVGGRRPQRIMGVWLISVGAFGGELADATFADVTVRSGGRAVEVFD